MKLRLTTAAFAVLAFLATLLVGGASLVCCGHTEPPAPPLSHDVPYAGPCRDSVVSLATLNVQAHCDPGATVVINQAAGVATCECPRVVDPWAVAP